MAKISSQSSTLLQAPNCTLSVAQIQNDAASRSFSAQATDTFSIASMTAAGLAGRLARVGFLSSSLSNSAFFRNFFSQVFGLSIEAAAFEGLNRAFNPFESHESFLQSCTAHFINFSTFRFVGAFGASSSALAQHFTQSFAMVAGHQVAGVLGVEEKPRGSLSEQLLQTSIATAQIQVGSALGALFSGQRLHRLERNLESFSQDHLRSHSPAPTRALVAWASERATSLSSRFHDAYQAEIETRIDAFMQHFQDLKDPAAIRKKLRAMERSFCTSLCDRLDRISRQHGLGDKPVILFDLDETILQRISKKDCLRPSLPLLLSFLRCEFPNLKFGIATSRHMNWEQTEEGCFKQAAWREVEGFFERDLLFTLSDDPRNTYEGRPTPLNNAASWDEARRERFYNEEFASLVANYLAHEQVLGDAIRQRVISSAKAEGREAMDWEMPEPFHVEDAREYFHLRLGVSTEQPLRNLPLETLLFKLSSLLQNQNQFERAETMPTTVEYPHEELRRSFQTDTPSDTQLEAKKSENQSLSPTAVSNTQDFERFFSDQTGTAFHLTHFTKLAAGRVLLDQNRASCCLVMDAACPHALFSLLDAAGDSEPNPYTLLGIRRYQHRLWMMDAGKEAYFSIY